MIKKYFSFLIIVSFFQLNLLSKTVYIAPGWDGIRLFDIEDQWQNGDDQRQFTYQLKCALEKKGFRVKQADSLKNLEDFFCLICLDIPFKEWNELSALPQERKILFLLEPPSIKPNDYNSAFHAEFGKIFTWHDEMIDNKKYFKFYYPVMFPMICPIIPFCQKKFCTMIACNKNSCHPHELYSQRKSTLSFFEEWHPDEFDLYGKWWPAHLQTYKGSVVRKVDILKNYKFCICYENVKDIPGYITEKIFDCFRAGCVPIYLGANNINDYIPQDCFIWRSSFTNNEELYHCLKNINQEQYDQYIENIRNFLNSTQAHLYSVDYFVELALSTILALEKTYHAHE